MNTDQGCQITSDKLISWFKCAGVMISVDGKGRRLDAVEVERFWRTINYEDSYLKSYENPQPLAKGLNALRLRHNTIRPHQTLDGKTQAEVYESEKEKAS
jgi:putative transposase